MKIHTLKVNLTDELRRYLKAQVRAGRYQNESDVIRDAIRQMRQQEEEQFERQFAGYPGAPEGEPTPEDERAIKTAIKAHRENRCRRQAA